MKIAILTPTFYHYSGIDRVAESQASEYARNGHEVTVFTFEATIKPKKYGLEVLGMPKNLFLQRLYRLLFFVDREKMKKTAGKLKDYDMVISHFYPMNWIASYAKKKFKVKYVYYNHGIGYSYLFSNPFERLYMDIFSFLNRLSLRNIDSAISVSKFMQRELKKDTGFDSKIIYNRIDKKNFRKNINGNKIRKKLGISKQAKLLLFVGRLSPHKNVHTLLKIFDIVDKKISNIKLLIVGTPTFSGYYKSLRKLANENVIFKVGVDDKELPIYYAACNLYVTASLWEGFDLPAAEVQACGKKVVAFDVCSHPEIVKNGILVNKDDIKGFVDAIILLLQK